MQNLTPAALRPQGRLEGLGRSRLEDWRSGLDGQPKPIIQNSLPYTLLYILYYILQLPWLALAEVLAR